MHAYSRRERPARSKRTTRERLVARVPHSAPLRCTRTRVVNDPQHEDNKRATRSKSTTRESRPQTCICRSNSYISADRYISAAAADRYRQLLQTDTGSCMLDAAQALATSAAAWHVLCISSYKVTKVIIKVKVLFVYAASLNPSSSPTRARAGCTGKCSDQSTSPI